MLETLFHLREHGTTARREILAGTTTFLTMAYICFVNPVILAETGMDFGAVFVATCIASAVGSLIMGLYANYPIALAPGMGLNAFFTYGVVLGLGHSWQTALGAVFIAGVIFLLLSALPVREWLINSIPRSLRLAIAAGIGLFLAFIALRNAGLVVADRSTIVALGDLTDPGAALALGGFVLMLALDRRGLPGAVLIGILVLTGISLALEYTEWQGIFAAPPDPSPTLMQMDIAGALQVGMISVILTFVLVDLFDSAGTLLGVAHEARMLDAQGRLPRLRQALLADSTATVAGAMLGTCTVTSYVESATGIRAGGRTGLTAVTVAAFFMLALFAAPLARTVPAFATAPALLYVGCLMLRPLRDLDWDDPTEYAPAALTAIAIPFSFSITDGIGLGLITYAAAKIASGRWRECPLAVALLALIFAARFSTSAFAH